MGTGAAIRLYPRNVSLVECPLSRMILVLTPVSPLPLVEVSRSRQSKAELCPKKWLTALAERMSNILLFNRRGRTHQHIS